MNQDKNHATSFMFDAKEGCYQCNPSLEYLGEIRAQLIAWEKEVAQMIEAEKSKQLARLRDM